MVKRGSATSEASTTISATNRSNKATTKGKDKTAKSERDDRDIHNVARTTNHYPISSNSRSLGGGRGGKTGSVKHTHTVNSSSNTATSVDKEKLLDQFGIRRKQTHALDPTLLARGMTARHVGSRVANFIKILSPEEMEKDLHHMEAYRCACVTYSQKLFTFINQDFMARDLLGVVPVTVDKPVSVLPLPSVSTSQMGTPVMPSKIDPDEEKRLAELRKKIAISEFKREGIESEYVSYRAHFVYQCHRLLLTRQVVYGQLHLLQDLIQKKASVLVIQRVMCSILKHMVRGLESRGTSTGAIESSLHSDSGMVSMEHSTEDYVEEKQKENNALWEAWLALESQLQTAETAVATIRPPKELLVVKNALAITSSAIPSTPSSTAQDLTTANGMSRRSRSPSKSRGQKDDDDSTMNGATKKRAKIDKDSKTISTLSFEKGKYTKLHNVDDGTGEKDHLTALGKKSTLSNEDRCIPWQCLSHPRTPMNVPLLASLLSESSSRFAGYGTICLIFRYKSTLLESDIQHLISFYFIRSSFEYRCGRCNGCFSLWYDLARKEPT